MGGVQAELGAGVGALSASGAFSGAVDLPALRMLCAVAERGSLSAAGVSLGVTQQAVSARMRRLESGLGLALIERSPAGSTLTAAGEVVAGWAAEVVAAADRLEEGAAALRADEGTAAGASVAASLTIAEHLLPRWLATLRAGGDDTRIAVTAVNSAAVLDLVAAGTHPLGFIETPGPAPGLRTTRLAWDELVVVVAPAHPWARQASAAAAPLTAAELAATPLVTREPGSGTRLATEHALARAGHRRPAPPAIELPTAAAIRTAVASGLAPAVLSILAVRDELASGRLVRVPLSDLRIVRELRAVIRRDAEMPEALRRLMRVARRGEKSVVGYL